jgi:response regulator RpfG family c-di-GMP phosphodiesterase
LNGSLERQVTDRTAELANANARLGKNYLGAIKAFSNLVELRGGSTPGHSRRVADLSRRLASHMGLPPADVQHIFVAALLHDIGLVGLPDALLACSVPRMTPEERIQYERHPALGEQALMALEDMQPIAMIVRSHHERHDGQGFPDGLSGEAIPLGARIVGLADTFEDLQAGHLARAELKIEDARMLIQRGRNAQFESALVDAFLEVTRTPEAVPTFVDLPVDKLKPGMVLARDLCSGEGQVLLAAGHSLSADLIQRIGAYATRHNLSLEIAVRTSAALNRLAA